MTVLFLAGDCLMIRKWSDVTDPGFLQLLQHMREADATVVNLETVIHTFKGYPQADSGGVHLASPPEIADDLKWAGVDAVATANNHSFDYGEIGVLETIEHLEACGLHHAGTGADLQSAQAPCFWDDGSCRFALISMTASFTYYAKAANSRPDAKGRPGVNPLTLNRRLALGCPPEAFARLREKAGARFRQHQGQARWRKMLWEEQPGWGLRIRPRPLQRELTANCDVIRSAGTQADLTIVSLHTHNEQPWLAVTCRKLIDEGADIVLVQGRHEVRGVEIYRSKPIFYGLGDFVFQSHLVAPLPAEAYERRGLPADATLAAYNAARRPYLRSVFEGAAATLEHDGRQVTGIRLLPVDLQPDAKPQTRGTPRLADPALGERIIQEIANQSIGFGTRIRFDHTANCGVVELETTQD